MADTRVRYVGPIDGVSLGVGRARVEVARQGEVELSDHLNQREAAQLARALVETGDWTTVQRDKTKGDEPGGDK